MKYLIGSKLLGLTNEKDKDYMIISNKYDYKRISENDEDILYRSQENILYHLRFEGDYTKHTFIYLVNYQYDREIIGPDFPIEYHILDHKYKLINFLQWIVANKEMNFNKNLKFKHGNCSKLIFHIAYNAFILQNNSPIITPEQKAIIQKIHDRQMPVDYLDELAAIINNLK